uniref:Uncharacterized protein n=1 Tax=Anguilla anguilla TaxID=7936 RepID=A0A0E9RCW3_ANGAN
MLGYFLIVNQHTCLFRIYHKSTIIAVVFECFDCRLTGLLDKVQEFVSNIQFPCL